MATIQEQLILHEGKENKPYRCTADKLTIGVGRNLDDKGLTDDEVMYLLKNDIQEAEQDLEQFDWYKKLKWERKRVLIDMRINLGLQGLLSFRNMIAKIESEEWEEAAYEMLDSKWAAQVGMRAERLAEMMRTGEDYD